MGYYFKDHCEDNDFTNCKECLIAVTNEAIEKIKKYREEALKDHDWDGMEDLTWYVFEDILREL